ncbi:MAG TPA: gliding motility-associated C-terminal domain-containing protein [Saprospiraceae bacterium]|nr:gliding motility-associated C-terminal domain-containing protein [Saprospiraceae bacterium]
MSTRQKLAAISLLLLACATPAAAQTGASPRANCISTCSGDLGENIFPDGDFGHGTPNVLATDPLIAPGYGYTQNPPPNDGAYTITNNTTSWGAFAGALWIDIEDHGPEPDGYMMVVNASYQPGLFYQKLVPVCENVLYEFSIDVISMNTPSAGVFIQPKVTFEIDGNAVCSTNEIAVTATWYTYRFSFSTDPGATQITLGLRNDAPGGYGNDLAIDNISFRACGPDINVPVTAFFCAGQPLNLSASLANSPYSPTFYQWQSLSAGNNTWELLPGGTELNHQIPQPVEGDQYRLVVASSLANLDLPYCRAVSQAVDLMLDDLSDFAIGGTDTIVCNGAPAVLDAGAFARYQWSTGAQTADIQAPAPGWYAVTVTSVHDCPAEDSLYVYKVDLTASADAEDPHCVDFADGLIVVNDVQGGVGPVRFRLNEGLLQAGMQFDSLTAGAFTVTVSDSLGCRFPMTVTLTDPAPVGLSIGGDQNLFFCDSLTLEAQSGFELINYLWSPAVGLSCTGCPSPVAMPLQTTVYSLQAIDERGCPATDSLRLTVIPRLDVYAPNVFHQDISGNGLNNAFALFPTKSATKIRRLEIFNRWGEMVFRRDNEMPGAEALRWDGTDFRGKTLDEGVFVWQAEIEFIDGGVRLYSGDVTLIRGD